ncbi:protein MpLOX6 [Marchantia polymorpha subsp. ruderalis]
MEGSLERRRDDLTIVAQVNVNLMKINLAGLTNPAQISIQLVSQTPNADSPGSTEPSKSAEVTLVNPPPANGTASQADEYDNQFPVVVPSFLLKFTQLADDFQVGAIIVRNNNKERFYLDSVKLNIHDVPKDSNDWDWVFECDSQVHPTVDPEKDFRVYFHRKAVFAHETLWKLMDHELHRIRGDLRGAVKHLEDDATQLADDLIYEFDKYNDLGYDFVLGGSPFPYPRRFRCTSLFEQSDSTTGHGNTVLQTFIHALLDKVTDWCFHGTPVEDPKKTFGSILEIAGMDNRFETTIKCLEAHKVLDVFLDVFHQSILSKNPFIVFLEKFINVFKELLQAINLPQPRSVLTLTPGVGGTWYDVLMNDEEFGRQALAGMNPAVITRLQTFPPSDTGKKITGLQHAVEVYLKSKQSTLEQAIEENKLYIIDYHDAFKAHVGEINQISGRKTYAGRAVFFYKKHPGKLIPIAIELSLPKDSGDQHCTLHRVFTPPVVTPQEVQPISNGKGGSSDPADEPVLDFWWELAKIHFISLDFSYHELVSHWLYSHAAMEPIIIATKRTLLSSVHPIGNLLEPTFRNTLNINSDARQILINKIGIIPDNFTAGEYSMKISSGAYQTWRFDMQSVTKDLLARGMAIRKKKDPKNQNEEEDVELVIEDYPFAQDALKMWTLIKHWVTGYVNIFYKSSADVLNDPQNHGALQHWWTEVRTRGHPDIKEGWPELDCVEQLIEILSTIYWIAGPHHAAVNFGQYDYAGYVIQRSSMTRQLIPELNVKMTQDAWRSYVLDTIATPKQTLQVMAILKVLSTHSEEEQYLGEDEWTFNAHGKKKGLIQENGEDVEDKDVVEHRKKKHEDLLEKWWEDIFGHKHAGTVKAANPEKDLQKVFKIFSDGVNALEKEIEAENKAARSLPWSNRISYSKLAYTLLLPKSKAGMTCMGVPYSTSI